MNLYTIDQVVADIEQFEGVSLKATELIENLRKCHYPKLYSKSYKSPMSDNRTVDDLKDRVNAFLFGGCLVDPDIFPTDEMNDLVIYALKNEGEPSQSMSFLGSYRDLAELQEKLPVLKLKELGVSSCVFLSKSTGSCMLADIDIGQLH